MHYKNGREAKNGDKVMMVPTYGSQTPVVGILYEAVPGIDSCNGRLAAISQSDPIANLGECLHIEDAMALLKPKAEVTAA